MPHQCTNCGRTFADGSKEMLSGCPDCGGNKFQFRPASESTPPHTASGSPPGTASDSPPDTASSSPSERIPDETTPTNPSDSDQREASSAPSSTTQPSTEANSSETSTTQPAESDAERDTGSWPDPATESDQDDLAAEGGLTDAAARAGAAVRDRLSRNRDDDASISKDSKTTDSDTDSDTVSEDSAQTTARSDVVSREELSAAARDVDSDHSETSSDAEPPSISAEDTVADTPSKDDHPDLSELRQELNDQFESIKIVSQGQYELNLMELYDRDEYIISLQEDGRYVIEVPDRWREGE